MAYNKKNVLEGNTEAIRVVLRLEKERREATETEKGILRGYQGFGGLKCVLNRCDSPDDLRYCCLLYTSDAADEAGMV